MDVQSARLSIAFSCAGHLLFHLLTALYLTVVLSLETAWAMPYDDLIRLWTFGSLLIGIGAPLAGWLGDRWSDARMMVAFFLITGGGTVGAGLADQPAGLWLSLAALGLGASIYHPVGMSWLIKNSDNPGQALGVLGIFGSVGTAVAALVAGALAAAFGWRAAFLVPGLICLGFGVLLVVLIATGRVFDRRGDRKPQPAPERGDVVRAFIVLSVTMLCAGVIWNSLQVVLPKWFETGVGALVDKSTLGIGGLVTLTYLVAAVPQLIGGRLADRYPVKLIYLVCLGLQVPLLALVTSLAGVPMLLAATVILTAISLQIPAENLLLARYTPTRYRGLAYGAKFVLTFGVGPVAVQLVAYFYDGAGTFLGLFLTLAALAATALVAAALLPAERSAPPVGRAALAADAAD